MWRKAVAQMCHEGTLSFHFAAVSKYLKPYTQSSYLNRAGFHIDQFVWLQIELDDSDI